MTDPDRTPTEPAPPPPPGASDGLLRPPRPELVGASGELCEQAARRFAVELARFAVGGQAGRRGEDPVYQEVTERRQLEHNAWRERERARGRPLPGIYSSCGDLPAWLLFTGFGVRAPWLNREANALLSPRAPYGRRWRIGKNLSMLERCPDCVRVERASAVDLRPGDVIRIGYAGTGAQAAHVEVVLEAADRLIVAAYGQGHTERATCARVRERALEREGGALYVGARRLYRHWPLAAVLRGALTRGELAELKTPTVLKT